jgi:hypothetical protein
VKAWWRTEEEPPPQSRIGGASQRPTHNPVSRPVEEAQRIQMPRRRARRSWRPSGVTLFAVIMAVLFVGVPSLIVYSVFEGVDDAVDSPSGFGGVDGDAAGPSLVRADRFTRALAEIRERAGSEGSIIAMRLDPARVSAVVRRSDGSGRVIVVARDLDVTELPGGSPGGRGLGFNRVDPAVPERLVRRAAERVGVKPDSLSYLAVSHSPPARSGGQWSVFFEGGRFATADLDGRNLVVPGQ